MSNLPWLYKVIKLKSKKRLKDGEESSMNLRDNTLT
jgi:hypothetical protein